MAFVAAALALGVCMGVNFSGVLDGPDLFSLLREVDPESLAEDVRQECLDGIRGHERAVSGDWLAIWGGKYLTTPHSLFLPSFHQTWTYLTSPVVYQAPPPPPT